MKLLKMTATRFKGSKELTVTPDGHSIGILGENGTGKTTVWDAYNYVLFGKDANWNSDFEIKTLGADGRAIPMQEHSVEIWLKHEGGTLRLKKIYSEMWVKGRGSVCAEFSGHQTHHFVNDVPVQKKEYDATIGKLCNELLLRVLTDPTYFSTRLPCALRRDMLMQLCGEPALADVIAANKALVPLEKPLAGQTIELYRKQIAARKAIVNSELKAIPVRVDEATRAMPASGDADPEKVRSELDAARQELQSIQTRLASGETQNSSGDTEKRLRLDANRRYLESLQRSAKDMAGEIERLSGQADELNEELNQKRQEWGNVDAEPFAPPEFSVCPACGQALPETLREEANEKAHAAFQADKDNRLAAISAAGKTVATHLSQIQNRRQALEQSLANAQLEQDALVATIGPLKKELEDVKQLPGHTGQKQETVDLTQRRNELQRKVDELARIDANAKQIQAGEQRIAQLKEQEKTLAADYAQLEQQNFLTEEFMRTKVRLLEEKINSRFKLARFRLFEQQVNGALSDVCEVLGPDLVPYNAGLNHAAQINTGIDIINTLSAHFGFTAPIFVDNAEAVTKLIDTPAQVIRLVVAEGEKELRVVEDEAKADIDGLGNVQSSKIRLSATRTEAPGLPVSAELSATVKKGPGF